MRRKLKPMVETISSKEGFTLIEVMFGMFCFMVAMLALSSLSANTWQGATVSRTKTEAYVLASRVIESLISQNYQDDAISDGDHTLIIDNYTVPYFIGDDDVLPNTKYVRVNVDYNLKGSPKFIRVYYLLPSVIR